MIEWKDYGYVLCNKYYNENYNLLYIFTKEHGKVSGLFRNNKYLLVSSFSYVNVLYSSRYLDKMGILKLLSCRELWVHFIYDPIKIKVLNNICQVLNFVLPLNAEEKEIYELTTKMYTTLISNDMNMSTACDVFRKRLLELLGFGCNSDHEQLVSKINKMLQPVRSVA